VSEESEPTLRRTVGGGATIGTVAALGTAAAGGVLGIVVARSLGPSGTGAYNVVTTAFLLAQMLSTLGLTIGLTYHASADRWHPGDAFRQAQIGALVLGLASAAVGMGFALLFRDSLFEGVPFGALAIAFGALPFAQSWAFSAALALALDRYETFALAPLTQNVVALALTAVMTPAFGVEGAVGALAIANFVTAGRLLLTRSAPAPQPGWLGRTYGELRRAISFGFKAYIPQALQVVVYRADLFVLNATVAAATVGRYAVALLVAEVGLMIPRSLAAVVLPRVSALEDSAPRAEQELVMSKAVRHTVALALPTAAMLAIGMLTIPFVFGEGFREAIGPGMVLIPGVLLAGLGTTLAAAIVGKGRPDLPLRTGLIVTPLTLVAYVLVIPELEAYGAALVSVAAGLAVALLNLWFFRATTGLPLRALVPDRGDVRDYRELARRGLDYLRLALRRRR
jgi:O-antigen/teichoic acid export membrane protein